MKSIYMHICVQSNNIKTNCGIAIFLSLFTKNGLSAFFSTALQLRQ